MMEVHQLALLIVDLGVILIIGVMEIQPQLHIIYLLEITALQFMIITVAVKIQLHSLLQKHHLFKLL